jgi:trimethylamine:corrinoid methyltransferase-like protein
MDRNAWVTWQENGAETMLDRIQNKLADILSQPPSIQLSNEVLDRISAVIQAAEQREGAFVFEKTG